MYLTLPIVRGLRHLSVLLVAIHSRVVYLQIAHVRSKGHNKRIPDFAALNPGYILQLTPKPRLPSSTSQLPPPAAQDTPATPPPYVVPTTVAPRTAVPSTMPSSAASRPCVGSRWSGAARRSPFGARGLAGR